MHAGICDPQDEPAMKAFAKVLAGFCAKQVNEGWGMGVSVLEYRIGDQTLRVFSDAWSVDIEGPAALVKGIQEAFEAERGDPAKEGWSRPAGP